MEDKIPPSPRNYNGVIVITWKQLAVVSSVLFSVTGVVLGIVMYIDNEFDELRSQIRTEFEQLHLSNKTAADDLNYRLGIHRGVAIGEALEHIEIE